MASKQFHFFATASDLRSLIESIEAQLSINYFLTGLFDDSAVISSSSLLSEPDLGIALYPDAVRGRRYIVLPSYEQIVVRAVPQRAGGIKYAIDQLSNPHSIVFNPGGKFEQLGIVAGNVGTVHDNTVALEIYKIFSKQIKKIFLRVHSAYVGPDALNAFEAGYRLTVDMRSPIEYDLAKL